LFIGSEGTLGVITEVTLRVYGLPEAMSSATCHFSEMEAAVNAVTALMQTGVDVARIEFLDELSMEAINAYSGSDRAVAPTLFLEFHGTPEGVARQAQDAGDVLAGFGALGYASSEDQRAGLDLWRARHNHFYASRALRSGARVITTDVCVPLSHLGEAIVAAHADIQASSLTATIAGHVGDGNFHVVILVDPEDEDEMKRAEEMNHRLVHRALEVDGTCTGEHGIGSRKMDFLERELPEGVVVMRSIKRALDPGNIMNPGKVLRLPPP
jgi:D-lactate dehydrogenase (cytochrome)